MQKPLLQEIGEKDLNNSQAMEEKVDRKIEAFANLLPGQKNSNMIVTSRYNIVTFLPTSIFEQFRRLANVYFLVLGIIAAIGEYTSYYETSVEAVAILTPMAIVVFISVIKDGIEDVKRHRADAKVNARKAQRVSKNSEVKECEWKTLGPGDIILLFDGDELPSDVVVLACGGIQGATCYVETAAIDGETNLKPRLPCLLADKEDGSVAKVDESVSLTSNRKNVTGVDKLSISLTVQTPTEVIDEFNGSVSFVGPTGSNHVAMLCKDNLLLRGSVLRATEWCVGIVVYCGKETKLSMNSKRAPSKVRFSSYKYNCGLFSLF